MINISVKENEKKKLEIRIDYIRTQRIFFEENTKTFDLDGINSKTVAPRQLLEEAMMPSLYAFSPMIDQGLAKNTIYLKTVDQTLYYSLLNEAGERIDGVIDKDKFAWIARLDSDFHFQHESDLDLLRPHFFQLMNYIVVDKLGGIYYFKSLPLLCAKHLNRTSLAPNEFVAKPLSYDYKNKAKEQSYTYSSIIYEIPSDNKASALRLIAFFHAFVGTRIRLIKEYAVDDVVKEGKYTARAPNYVFGDNSQIANKAPVLSLYPFIEAVMKKMHSLPDYADLFKDLQTIYRYANDWAFFCGDEAGQRDLLSDIVFDEERVSVILQFKSPVFLYDENIPLSERQAQFEQMIIAFDRIGLQKELKRFVQESSRAAINNFLKEHTHSKKALGGGAIEWDRDDKVNSTEVSFLAGSLFSLRNGRICVQNHADNPHYQFYTDAKNVSLLTPEVSFLVNELLQCAAEDSDFHQGIVFTEAGSKQLMNHGLHFNAHYLEEFSQYHHDSQKKGLKESVSRDVLTERDKRSIASLSALGLQASIAKNEDKKTETANNLANSSEEERCCCRLL